MESGNLVSVPRKNVKLSVREGCGCCSEPYVRHHSDARVQLARSNHG